MGDWKYDKVETPDHILLEVKLDEMKTGINRR